MQKKSTSLINLKINAFLKKDFCLIKLLISDVIKEIDKINHNSKEEYISKFAEKISEIQEYEKDYTNSELKLVQACKYIQVMCDYVRVTSLFDNTFDYTDWP